MFPISVAMETHSHANPATWHGTTILSVRKNGKVVIAGDGQVSMGQTVMKPNAKKVRQLHDGSVIGCFAGATADAFTLFERFDRSAHQLPAMLSNWRRIGAPTNICVTWKR